MKAIHTSNAADQLNFEYIQEYYPAWAKSVEDDIKNGVPPREIKRAVFEKTRRHDLATRVESAALFVERSLKGELVN